MNIKHALFPRWLKLNGHKLGLSKILQIFKLDFVISIREEKRVELIN